MSLTYVFWTEEILEVVIIEMTFQFMFFFVMAAVKDFITKGSRVPAEVQKTHFGTASRDTHLFFFFRRPQKQSRRCA